MSTLRELQQISKLVQSSLQSERIKGVKRLNNYLHAISEEKGQQQQVSALIGTALADKSDRILASVLEGLIQNFTAIKIEPQFLTPRLMAIYKGPHVHLHKLVIFVLAKIIEADLGSPYPLIHEFFGSFPKREGGKDQNAALFLHMLCSLVPVHPETKRFYFNLLFNPKYCPVPVPTSKNALFRDILAMHFWELGSSNQAKLVNFSQTGTQFPVDQNQVRSFLRLVPLLNLSANSNDVKPGPGEIVQSIPQDLLPQFLNPFFFIEVSHATQRPLSHHPSAIDITATLGSTLNLDYHVTGAEFPGLEKASFLENVADDGGFRAEVEINQVPPIQVPVIFDLSLYGREIPLTLHLNIPYLEISQDTSKQMEIKDHVEFCPACGTLNSFSLKELCAADPLYCSTCQMLLKSKGEIRFG